ncbi:hypothetical protein I0P70_19375 [Pontibacter sp. FD36]|uniref:Uncharacterized protein n=2 Tax=Pontibacter TaxID=323449 RepID=A0A1N7B8C6_9BACT|nr:MULTISPECIES: hypothetical protein [Pontibacter]MBF8965419.1 hypothetical protein [Pontibacter sp. FD36]SIR47615.1 hypothetical protein SAMN05421545_3805 [Pontibacter lucknowensis]
MENKTNKNSQSNQNPTAQSSSQSNTSNMGSSQSSASNAISGNQSSARNSSGNSQSASSGKSNWKDTFKKENLDNLTGKLQEFGNSTMNKVNGLSTTQKVVGGSLLALGAGWVAMNSMNKNKSGKMGSKIASAQEKLKKNLNKNLGSNR